MHSGDSPWTRNWVPRKWEAENIGGTLTIGTIDSELLGADEDDADD
jgi:hypothetical protein